MGGINLATVYFQKALCKRASEIIKLKGTIDKIKVFNDMEQIDNVLAGYVNGFGYNEKYAAELDARIRREYSWIEKMDQLPPTQTSYVVKEEQKSVVDSLMNRLDEDRYGIMFTVLLKEGIVHGLEDFVERVE